MVDCGILSGFVAAGVFQEISLKDSISELSASECRSLGLCLCLSDKRQACLDYRFHMRILIEKTADRQRRIY